jgi:crotonobetainyl-CoA:carnitine CoA-transferase CaiB-like acyl-CoA transferase
MQISRDSAPLEGTRAIDFGHYFAGPLAGMLLADQGAEVIKVDRPGAPGYDSAADAVFNRGKHRLRLDLKTAEGAESAKRLIQTADVVIENFRPGVMQRLGLGPAEMTELDPRLVYLSLPGFASNEDKASLRAFEGVISAATGLFSDLHTIRRELEAPPVYTPLPVASAYAAVHGALAATLALYSREETGRGEIIEVPLAGAALSAMGAFVLQVEDPPPAYDRRLNPANDSLRQQMKHADPAEQARLVDQLRSMFHPMWDSYRTGDGGWVYMLAHSSSRHSRQLMRALRIYDGLIEAGLSDLPQYDDLRRSDNLQFAEGLTPDWKEEIRRRMTEAFTTKSAHEWAPVMREHGVPFSVHRTARAWLEAPEPEAAALVVIVEDPTHGSIRQFGVQTSLSRTADKWLQPSPAAHGNLEELLASHTNGSQHGETPSDSTRPILDGITVLDLSTVLAGPCCARTLAEYGANVIKIDNASPYFGPGTMCMLHLEVGQGKRSMILDLKSEAGMAVFQQLVQRVDIVVQNFRPGVAERLKIDYESLSEINPELIYVNLTAFNGPRPGPWADLPGFDPVLQAATGIQTRYGGEGNPPELHGFASCIDYLTGYTGAFGIALSLLKRRRIGGGDLVLTSLAQSAQFVQAPFMLENDSYQPGEEPQGLTAQGEHALQRLYQTSDGWIYLAGLESDIGQLQQVAEFADAIGWPDDDDLRVERLQAAIREAPASYWEEAFHNAGLGCHRVNFISEIRQNNLREVYSTQLDDWVDGNSISVLRMMDHPVGSPTDNPAPTYARFKHTSLRLGAPNSKLGSDTRQVLRELGYERDEIGRLIAAGVARDQLHEEFLPH